MFAAVLLLLICKEGLDAAIVVLDRVELPIIWLGGLFMLVLQGIGSSPINIFSIRGNLHRPTSTSAHLADLCISSLVGHFILSCGLVLDDGAVDARIKSIGTRMRVIAS